MVRGTKIRMTETREQRERRWNSEALVRNNTLSREEIRDAEIFRLREDVAALTERVRRLENEWRSQ